MGFIDGVSGIFCYIALTTHYIPYEYPKNTVWLSWVEFLLTLLYTVFYVVCCTLYGKGYKPGLTLIAPYLCKISIKISIFQYNF